MSRGPVSLLPIFRSEAQYRLVGELFTHPGREATVGELAGDVGASHATVSREVSRLAEAGLVSTRMEGRRRLVSARPSPVFRPLRDLMAVVYGVPAVVGEEFGDLDADVVVFGSWADRWFGEPGPVPNDVDVLVVGEVEPAVAWDAAARATRRLGIEVNVVVRRDVEWDNDDSRFAQEVKHGRRVVIAERADQVRTPRGSG